MGVDKYQMTEELLRLFKKHKMGKMHNVDFIDVEVGEKDGVLIIKGKPLTKPKKGVK